MHWSNNHSYLPKEVILSGSTSPLWIFPPVSKGEFFSVGITPAIYVRTMLVMRSIWSMVGTHSEVTIASASTREARQKQLLQLCIFDLLSNFIKYGLMTFQMLDDGKRDILQLPKQNPLSHRLWVSDITEVKFLYLTKKWEWPYYINGYATKNKRKACLFKHGSLNLNSITRNSKG